MSAGEYDIDAMVHDAGLGNRVAQSGLASISLGFVAEGDLPELEALTCAETFARMAVAHGQADDALLLAVVLQLRAQQSALSGRIERALEQQQEADTLIASTPISGDAPAAQFYVAWMDRLADQGDDAASERVNRFIGMMSPADAAKVRNAAPKIMWMVEPFVRAKTAPLIEFETPPALTRRERVNCWLGEVGFNLKMLGWAFADLGRAIRGKY